MRSVLNIVWLYPDVLNLHGDRGNVMALMRVCEQSDIKANLTRVEHLGDDFSLDDADIVVVGPGELASMPTVAGVLATRRQQFDEYVESGRTMLVVGTSAALVARETKLTDAPGFAGLALIDAEVTERAEIYGDDLIVRADGEELAGIQVRLTDLRLGSADGFGEVLYGIGNDPSVPQLEGARRGNLIVTNLLGPMLAVNPWYAWRLIDQAMRLKGGAAQPVDDEQWVWERRGAAANRAFVAGKTLPPGAVRSL